MKQSQLEKDSGIIKLHGNPVGPVPSLKDEWSMQSGRLIIQGENAAKMMTGKVHIVQRTVVQSFITHTQTHTLVQMRPLMKAAVLTSSPSICLKILAVLSQVNSAHSYVLSYSPLCLLEFFRKKLMDTTLVQRCNINEESHPF